MPEILELPEIQRESLLKDLDIPSVRERDPDPQAGPRLNVTEFRVQGLVEYPELGITREEIIKQVEAIRFDLMDEGELLDSGYTIEELAEISDLIAQIEEETEEEHVGPLEVQRLVFLIREQRRKRGITLGMIETVADTVTNYYRERGFILAKAYIPEQRVRDGIVNLTLLLGVTGEVAVNNNNKYRTRTIQRPFDDIMGKPVTSENIEERLFLLNDLPGVSAQGYFQPGSQVGDTKLNINVLSESSFNANVRLDNHGGEQAGEYRTYADFSWNNPTGFGDQLFIGGLYSTDPGSTFYGAMRYNINLFSPRLNFEAGISKNAFELGPGSDEGRIIDFLEGATGDSDVWDVVFSLNLKRSRTKSYYVDLAFENITSTLESGIPSFTELLLNDEVQNIKLSFNFDILREKTQTLHQGKISYTNGRLVNPGEFSPQDDNFNILTFDYTLLTFVTVPFTDANSRLIIRASGQYSPELLTSISQYGLGGPLRARGFTVSEFFADKALYAGVDWLFDAPEVFSLDIQPFVFLDTGFGQNDPRIDSESKETAKLANVGVGLKSFYQNFRANLQVAFPIVGDIDFGAESEEIDTDTGIYFDFQYVF